MKTNRKVKVPVIALITAGLCGVILFSGCPGAGVENGDETGIITGKAAFSGGGSNAGIIVSIEKVEGGRAASLIEREPGRAVTSAGTKTTTDADGNFTFEKVSPGNYTIYASSRDSKEKAIALDVAVSSGRTVTVEGLDLTPVGHLSGTVTIDNQTTGNLGTLVFIAGTSYMALTDDAGAFTISDVPVKTGYSIVVSRDGVSGVWKTANVTKGLTTGLGTKNVTSDPESIRGLRIIYDGNHYDYGTLPVDAGTYEKDDAVQVQEAGSFGREGWAFAGWNTRADGTGTAYFPASWHITSYNKNGSIWTAVKGAALDRDTVTFGDSDITLYAIWAIGWFDVLEDGGGNFSAAINWHADVAIGKQDLIIPSQINTIPVTAIKPWVFMDCIAARQLVIPDRVTEIGDGVFYNTYNVSQVTLGANVVFSGIDSQWRTDLIQVYTAGGKRAGTYKLDAGAWALVP